MKKILSVLIAVALLVSVLPIMASAAFPDMPSTHWAASQVDRLVSEGTINGMPDGTFSPNGTVTRAQFVKMLGKSDVKFAKDFLDVPADNWAYEYVMYSQLEGDTHGRFNPNEPIRRDDVAKLLYKRFANGAETRAPYSISSQGTNPLATAWVYNTGLIIGSDGLNLRLDDTLTRAEAAVLIVRAKDLNPTSYNNFVDKYSSEVYKNIYEKSNIFDSAYDENGNITREELAIAALRFQYGYRSPAVRYVYEAKYDGEYAMHWDIMCRYALDDKNYGSTKENADKYATVEDAVAMLTLGAKNSIYVNGSVLNGKGKTFSDVQVTNAESNFASVMAYAYEFGISLNAGDAIGAKNLVTKKQVAQILLQYELYFGSQAAYHCGYESGYITPYTRLDASSYPSNHGYYANISNDIPNFVYEKPFPAKTEVKLIPKDFATIGAMLGYTYATTFMYVAEAAYEKGADIYVDYYPTLALRLSDNTEIYRVKISVNKAFQGMKLSDVLPLGEGVADRTLNAGDSLWVDVNSNQSTIGKLYIDYEIMTIDAIVE